jgi:hypothetical protein
MLDLFVFLVLFTAGGHVKNTAWGIDSQGFHKMNKTCSRSGFEWILGSVLVHFSQKKK